MKIFILILLAISLHFLYCHSYISAQEKPKLKKKHISLDDLKNVEFDKIEWKNILSPNHRWDSEKLFWQIRDMEKEIVKIIEAFLEVKEKNSKEIKLEKSLRVGRNRAITIAKHFRLKGTLPSLKRMVEKGYKLNEGLYAILTIKLDDAYLAKLILSENPRVAGEALTFSFSFFRSRSPVINEAVRKIKIKMKSERNRSINNQSIYNGLQYYVYDDNKLHFEIKYSKIKTIKEKIKYLSGWLYSGGDKHIPSTIWAREILWNLSKDNPKITAEQILDLPEVESPMGTAEYYPRKRAMKFVTPETRIFIEQMAIAKKEKEKK